METTEEKFQDIQGRMRRFEICLMRVPKRRMKRKKCLKR